MAALSGEGEGQDALGRLLSWFESHGGSVAKLCLADLGGEMGLSIVAGEAVKKGDVVMSIPIALCLTVESAQRSDLATMLEANPELMNTPDEVLALHLMSERRRGEKSFWAHYLRTLPDDVDTPLRWTVEGAEEVRLLEGTMVGLLSRMMHSQVVRDWEDVHLPLIEAYPDVLGGIVFEDYLWALSSLWSRAFDYLEQLPDGSNRSHRAMVPVINAANHNPSAAENLSDMIDFDSEGGVAEEGKEGPASGRLRVRAGRDYDAQEQLYILYGRYSNAKLLYSYGFVLPSNPYGGIDYWVKVPRSDPSFEWKQALLDSHSLTAVQAYDFSGTLRTGGWVSPALLATARVAQLNTAERGAAENAFNGKVVSPRNEAAAVSALLGGIRRKLIGQKSSAADEKELIAGFEAAEQRQQRQQLEEGESQGIIIGNPGTMAELPRVETRGSVGRVCGNSAAVEATEGSATVEEGAFDVGRRVKRQLAAARVRLEEKTVLAEAIAVLEASLRELQSAVSVGSESAAELVSFRPLDADEHRCL